MKNTSQRAEWVTELLDAFRAAATTDKVHDAQRMRCIVTRYEEDTLQNAATMEEYSKTLEQKLRRLRSKAQSDAQTARIHRALEHATEWTWRRCHLSTMHIRAAAEEFVRTMHARHHSDRQQHVAAAVAAAVDRECERLRRCGEEKERAATLDLWELWQRRLEPHEDDVKVAVDRALGVHERGGSNTPPRSGETSRGKRHRRARDATAGDGMATSTLDAVTITRVETKSLADEAKRMMREIFQPPLDVREPGKSGTSTTAATATDDNRNATRRHAVLDYLAEEHPALVQNGDTTMLGAVTLVDRVRVENIHAHLQEALREPDDWQSDPVGRRIRAKMLEHLRRGGGRYDRLQLTELTRRLRKGDRYDPDLGAETRQDVERWAFQVVTSIAHLEKDPVDHRVYATVRSHLY